MVLSRQNSSKAEEGRSLKSSLSHRRTTSTVSPAIKPVAVRMVWESYNAIKIPIIGMGGIMNAENAIEFMLAGATAVAVGTANFINPKVAENIIAGIEDYLKRKGIRDVKEIIGGMKTP